MMKCNPTFRRGGIWWPVRITSVKDRSLWPTRKKDALYGTKKAPSCRPQFRELSGSEGNVARSPRTVSS